MMDYRITKSLRDGYFAYQFIKDLDALYPNLDDWWFNKVLPGLLTGEDGLIVAEQHHHIVGMAAFKLKGEKKLRCVRVSPEMANRGLGVHLIDRALKAMDCSQPLVTVAEEKLHEYSRIFINRFDFQISKVERGLYRKGKLEYIFNGEMAGPTPYGG